MGKTFGSYKRVFMLGIDGMGAFNGKTETPNMDKLFANGAMTYTALASSPTISAQCWTSMLTGSTPEVHGLTNGDMHPIPNLPTIFKLIKEKYPEAETAAFTDWSPIAKSIISPDGGLTAYDVGHDDDLCDRLLVYLEEHDPKMLFVQFDSVDSAGHHFGYGSDVHLERITHVDGLLGKLLAKYEERGFSSDTLFIVTADHGGTPGTNGSGGGHGGWSDAEKFVFLGVAGKNVKHGEIGEVCLRDFPTIVLHALGVETPEFNINGFAGQMPIGIFEGEGVLDRIEVFPKKTAFERIERLQPEKGHPDYIGNFIDPEKISFWQTFENGIEDVSSNCSVSTKRGFVKTYNNGFVGKSGEFGNSLLEVSGVKHSKIFSFAFWYYTSNDSRWMDLFSNKDGVHPGFSIAPFGEQVGIYVKKPEGGGAHIKSLQINTSENAVSNGWVHFMFEVNIPERKITGYVNFEKSGSVNLDLDIEPHFNTDVLYMGLDQYHDELFYKVVDDVMIIDGPAEPLALKAYYKV